MQADADLVLANVRWLVACGILRVEAEALVPRDALLRRRPVVLSVSEVRRAARLWPKGVARVDDGRAARPADRACAGCKSL